MGGAARSRTPGNALAERALYEPVAAVLRSTWAAGNGFAGADVLVDDLSDTKIKDRINGWVRQKTHDLIPSIIEEAPATLGLVAVNALYFKDRWKTQFDPARQRKTCHRKFHAGATGGLFVYSARVFHSLLLRQKR